MNLIVEYGNCCRYTSRYRLSLVFWKPRQLFVAQSRFAPRHRDIPYRLADILHTSFGLTGDGNGR